MNNVIVYSSKRGGTIVSGDTANMKLRELLELIDKAAYIKRHFAALIGNGIGQNEAAKKYGIAQTVISRWASLGHIKAIGTGAHGKVLIDESDIAYAAAAYRALELQAGQKLFNKDGSLYIPKPLLESALKPTR